MEFVPRVERCLQPIADESAPIADARERRHLLFPERHGAVDGHGCVLPLIGTYLFHDRLFIVFQARKNPIVDERLAQAALSVWSATIRTPSSFMCFGMNAFLSDPMWMSSSAFPRSGRSRALSPGKNG